MLFLSSPPVRLQGKSPRMLRAAVSGTLITTKKEVLRTAKPVDDGIRSLRKDMAENLYRQAEDEWALGCEMGFSDAYSRGYYNLGGIKEPDGSAPYVEAYRRSFSGGNGYILGKAAKARGAENANYERNEDPVVIKTNLTVCRSGFEEWIKSHPQGDAPGYADQHRLLWNEFTAFDERWSHFYTGLFDLGPLESGDSAIEDIRSYYNEFLKFVKRYEAFGFKATYVPPPPQKTGSDAAITVLTPGLKTAATIVVGGTVGYLLLKRYLDKPARR